MTRRIVYLTGTRADFGLMLATLRRIAATPGLALKVAATGMHLAPELGNTIAEVRASSLKARNRTAPSEAAMTTMQTAMKMALKRRMAGT